MEKKLKNSAKSEPNKNIIRLLTRKHFGVATSEELEYIRSGKWLKK